jgi:hypothetical protein
LTRRSFCALHTFRIDGKRAGGCPTAMWSRCRVHLSDNLMPNNSRWSP